jgi:hypothetical protein
MDGCPPSGCADISSRTWREVGGFFHSLFVKGMVDVPGSDSGQADLWSDISSTQFVSRTVWPSLGVSEFFGTTRGSVRTFLRTFSAGGQVATRRNMDKEEGSLEAAKVGLQDLENIGTLLESIGRKMSHFQSLSHTRFAHSSAFGTCTPISCTACIEKQQENTQFGSIEVRLLYCDVFEMWWFGLDPPEPPFTILTGISSSLDEPPTQLFTTVYLDSLSLARTVFGRTTE